MMTIEEFCEKVESSKIPFYLQEDFVRCDIRFNEEFVYCCPLTALYNVTKGEAVGVGSPKYAGRGLGLSDEDVSTIVYTADNDVNDTFFNPVLRARMKRWCKRD